MKFPTSADLTFLLLGPPSPTSALQCSATYFFLTKPIHQPGPFKGCAATHCCGYNNMTAIKTGV